jgi:hypothetical protein
MNEQIAKLANESGFDVDKTGIFGNYSEMHRIEKFAKLIVEECMWKIMTRKEEAIDNNWRVDEAMSAAISDISEHFGVEQ